MRILAPPFDGPPSRPARSDRLTVECRMPIREEIIRVRPGPEWQAPVQIAQTKSGWLLLPTHGQEHANLRPKHRVLRLAVNTLGYPFLWPTAVLGKESNRQAALKRLLEVAERGWVQAGWIGGAWEFEFVATPNHPAWPAGSLDDLAAAAFPEAVEILRRRTDGARP